MYDRPVQPGWYPDPNGIPGLRWFDGEQWTPNFSGAQQGPAPSQAVAEKPKDRNPLFLFLAGLSALPTAFFGWAYYESQATISGILFLFCFAWTYCWWKMSDRYR
ncbi:DUF2510 domain-containing protein [Mycolicibacterium aichiense]|uniref:Uncharacterized protein n=1 Tax=Mycolicibacterium aichiense TaxID=1799 RepID=A0A378VAV0_9MYCO|nr:DUF2510 domain-containing protein [Mycolicibacterium aichiense]QFG08000.1 hypothetical protein SEA_HERBERTWM_30 [Mycobacterium phage Herbertwm]MCV7016712.1 DUF2510 domain-containing protein [Mycolicibacterium aichiense]SUA14073.1 Protein of uncharacterised function (DUF2510) [Mycolicibacterium aichiense]SUA14430.1 Protein of uncharacterised function (DUF2510) [Mycolicibacterium aichiense]BBX09508.1 hypothetical protein MAIC_43110 [Mycolicibacterium aichiense]